MANLKLKNVTKIFASNKIEVVKDFNLDIEDKEFIVLVGPSGCGKTTTLRMIAGLEDITSGEIFIDNILVNNIAPSKRNIAMVFQSYALYPDMTVEQNIGFSLRIKKTLCTHTNENGQTFTVMRKLSSKERKEKVLEVAKKLGLEEYLHRKPATLSGGQRQRVALGRAIIRNAKVYLFDEPLSNLDAKLRVQMREEIIRLHQELKTTFVYVTHDQVEAMTMATKIVIMDKGIIQQIGTPMEVYSNPSNLFVASFIGVPSINLIEGVIKDGYFIYKDVLKLKLSPLQLQKFTEKESLLRSFQNKIDLENISLQKSLNENNSKLETPLVLKQNVVDKDSEGNLKVVLGIRPEYIKMSLRKMDNYIQTKANIIELLGYDYNVSFSLGDLSLILKKKAGKVLFTNTEIFVNIDINRVFIFNSLTQERII